MGLVTIALVGGVAGLLADQSGGNSGLARNVIVGMAGALAAGLFMPRGGFMGGSFLGAILAAALGAIASLLISRLIRRA